MKIKSENKVLEFFKIIHDFEKKHDLFTLNNKGICEWDIVRSKVIENLFYKYFINETYYESKSEITKVKLRFVTKVKKTLIWLLWFLINEINFYISLKPKKYIFLKISRFQNTKGVNDAVSDEIYDCLKADSNEFETFKNKQTDIVKLGHIYQTFHLFTFKNLYRKFRFRKNKNYSLTDKLLLEFPNTKTENWNELIQKELLDFEIEYRFAKRIFKKSKPKGFFFTGIAKGYTQAANDLGIAAIEIQHSPLNAADIFYSYNKLISYENIKSLPKFLLVNSNLWEERIFYPPKFINIGSNYFFNSSFLNESSNEKNTILFVSDLINNALIKNYIKKIIATNKFNLNKIVFKLHSAETAIYELTKKEFQEYKNVEVILNQKNISELLDESIVAFVIYSTVAYQAIQKGVKVNVLKTGYYEGAYDILGLNSVNLVDLNADIDESLLMINRHNIESIIFFEKLEVQKLMAFIKNELN